jgi:peptidoglycan/LPS O-acetylase OafA/YrhL
MNLFFKGANDMQRKEKITALDFVRAVAILGVLIIHSTANGTLFGTPGSTTQQLMKWPNYMSPFAVPVFLFLSGLVLFYNYEAGWSPRRIVAFFRKRLVGILLPYVLISLFYHAVYGYFYSHDLGNLHVLISQLLTGSASYHLYFMIILFQFYLLFPFIMSALSLWPKLKPWFGLLMIGVQAYFVYRLLFVHYIPGVQGYWMNYWIYFFLGGYAGLYYERLKPWLLKGRWLLVLTALAIGVYRAGFAIYKPEAIGHLAGDTLFRLYGLICAFAFLAVGIGWQGSGNRIKAVFNSLGRNSFGIYLIHPFFQTAFGHFFPEPGNPYKFVLYTLCKFVVVLSSAWLATSLYGRAKGMWKGKFRNTKSAVKGASA